MTLLQEFRIVALAMVVAAAVAATSSRAGSGDEDRFLAENDAALSRMMADMRVRASGDIDKDFVAMMVPHHQGAVDMAVSELLYGHNEKLRRIAQEIIDEQPQEIDAMSQALGVAQEDTHGTRAPRSMKDDAIPGSP
jgi:uncharacterized protein (DUF305 family)